MSLRSFIGINNRNSATYVTMDPRSFTYTSSNLNFCMAWKLRRTVPQIPQDGSIVKLREEIQHKPSATLTLTLHLVPARLQHRIGTDGLAHACHMLQEVFGIADFLTLVPATYSQHFLHDEVGCSICRAISRSSAFLHAATDQCTESIPHCSFYAQQMRALTMSVVCNLPLYDCRLGRHISRAVALHCPRRSATCR